MQSELFKSELEKLGLSLSEEQIEQFDQFETELYHVNETRNLTRVPQDECWQRHFLDSLLFQDLIPHGTSVLDIGCGPGFPAWPLACARPDLKVAGVDSNGKMLGFLQEHLLDNLTATQVRAEEWHQTEKFDVVTGRALAPLSTQLELSARPCKMGGLVIPMRSSSDRATLASIDLKALGLELEAIAERQLAQTDIVRLFPVYRKVQRTGAKFPRRWAEMKAKPL